MRVLLASSIDSVFMRAARFREVTRKSPPGADSIRIRLQRTCGINEWAVDLIKRRRRMRVEPFCNRIYRGAFSIRRFRASVNRDGCSAVVHLRTGHTGLILTAITRFRPLALPGSTINSTHNTACHISTIIHPVIICRCLMLKKLFFFVLGYSSPAKKKKHIVPFDSVLFSANSNKTF